MTSVGCPQHESPLHKLVYDLLCALHSGRKPLDSVEEPVKILLTELLSACEKRIENLDHDTSSWALFAIEWTRLTWSLLAIISRLTTRFIDPRHIDAEEQQLTKRLNIRLFDLINKARPVRPLPNMPDHDYKWIQFYGLLAPTLTTLHNLYSQLDTPVQSLDTAIATFSEAQLRPCLESFRELCRSHSLGIFASLRRAQLDRMANFHEIPDEKLRTATAYYTSMLYTLGILASRLQGFRFEWQCKFPYSMSDPVRNLLDIVYLTVDQLVADCLFAAEPATNAILVTNNLFPFNCDSLAHAVVFKQFDVQIVSEETAQAVQIQMNKVREGTFLPHIPGSFPSAALLAMKPTSGVKRNNAVANAEGGNTAHKKSDVNSKESVVIVPSYNENLLSWQATYPHLLCTTRQKDTVLLDSRAGQIGKRPVFYFYIRATTFSPSGGLSYARSLSLPFTIATRRNQDCQVQRMMSSYTATCFWLYGTSTLDGLILNWSDNGIKWSHFKQLYQTYFTVNAEVKRSLSDIDFQLMKEKMECEDCREHTTAIGEEPLLTFKNVLCPHLRYDCDQNVLRFSIWRGNLEVLQIFQDARTNVKQLWDDFILHGLTDIDDINEMLSAQPSSVMFLRISYIAGGIICISTRGERGIIHLEPIELKKLQAKSVFEYMADIAESERIEYVLTAEHLLVPVAQLVEKYKIGTDSHRVRNVQSNITHSGSLENTCEMSFTPLRIAVVTCREASPETILPTVPMNDYTAAPNQVQPLPSNSSAPFISQLHHLMKLHGKSPSDVMNVLGYTNVDAYQSSNVYGNHQYQ
ncbi:hypothetical protein KIN20_001739 [Parelaphostrongylus tenuis]|uniref:Uncharacterized protein n=1 Tax=Parelaphostrongylus tenuis TaxID=148309 RepID=A0AAD5LWN2_PARTN|nr:hypothetical protein KIN20_001739 [Parelaphostrongylus tenuis]